ncbi:MAG: transglutaminase-like domain-containing protein [Candidatus Thiodiazotropha sp.]
MQRMRSPRRWVPFVSLVTAIVLVTYYQLSSHQTAKLVDYPTQRTVKYSFTVKNPNSYPIAKSELRVNAPIRLSAFQQLADIKASQPYKLTEDGHGNEQMAFLIENMPPYANRTITVSVSVNLSAQGNRVDIIQDEAFLGDDKFVGLSNPDIQRVASRLHADAPKDTADRIYRWITSNIKKSSYVRNDIGAPQALKTKSGDCTEFMYLFSALARANGIPTRNMAGFVARENRVLRPADYHNWNEAYIDGEWYLIDADKQVFMGKSDEYIAMRLIGNMNQTGTMSSQSFFSASDDIQVHMN